MVMTNKCERR